MRAYERLMNYVKVHTTSQDGTGRTPTTERQLDLARILAEEMRAMGIADARVDGFGYVYGSLPATPGCEKSPAIGWIAHMDTAQAFSGENVKGSLPATPGCEKSPAIGWIAHMDTAQAFSGENVKPILHENYDGGDVALPQCGRVLKTSEFPFLKELKGKTLITADGSTLLGADDKAGIAEILTACEQLLQSGAPHGPVKIAFTPDEEVGEGADHFDVPGFGAAYAYTMDGGEVGEISYENFNAASAVFRITGVSVHPGSAKDTMVNALKLACEIDGMLPPREVPEHTEGREGFFHMDALSGDTAAARLEYIVRDHDREKFEARKELLRGVEKAMTEKYPTARVELALKDSYYNMLEQIRPCMHLIDNAKKACEAAGIQWFEEATRGGTDGARLSYMGLPCPNLGTGGHNFHGPYECITAESMDKAVEIILNIIALYAA